MARHATVAKHVAGSTYPDASCMRLFGRDVFASRTLAEKRLQIEFTTMADVQIWCVGQILIAFPVHGSSRTNVTMTPHTISPHETNNNHRY